MVTVYFDVHARSLDNEADRVSGHMDVELSEYGRMQAAKEKTARYSDIRLDMVFTSDLKRCAETVGIMFRDRTVPVIKDKRLRECDYGSFAGKPRAELLKIAGDRIDEPFAGGESYSQVIERLHGFLTDLLKEHQGKSVLLMGHGSLLWGLERLLYAVPLPEAMRMPPVENIGKKYLVTAEAMQSRNAPDGSP